MIRKFSVTEQLEILHYCVKAQEDLDNVLSEKGITYDALRYRDGAKQATMFEEGSFVPGTIRQREKIGIPTVSFFSGAGGMDLGFAAAGFTHLAAIEANAVFCRTLRANFPSVRVIGPPENTGDVRNREEILCVLRKELHVRAPFEGIFHGGPPCQSFSIAANQRFAKSGKNFKRIGFAHRSYGTLLFDYAFYVCELRPRAFVVENVAGLLAEEGRDQFTAFLNQVGDAGYRITGPVVVNAASYGVPQNRHRAFIVGVRGAAFDFPKGARQPPPCGAVLSESAEGMPNHITRKHRAESILRYMELRFGQRDHLGRVDRLDPRLPSKTVIAGGTRGGGRSHLHPFIPRTLSVRECARLQTFPDNFIFEGPPARQFTQVGNAVPPLLAAQMAHALAEQIFHKHAKSQT